MARRGTGWLLALGLLALPPSVHSQAAGSQTIASDTGRIEGRVTLSLPQRGERPVRYYRGPYRASHDDDARPAPVQSVVVYVENVPPPMAPIADEPALMRQFHDRFIPHVLPVLRGRTVSFPNDDDYFHNVFSVVAGDRFDLGRYGQGDTRLQTFDDPAVVVVRCEIHPSMKAYILVLENPLFAVADAEGGYRIEGVPPGTWSVVAWHPTRGRERRTVTVPAGGKASLDVDF
jgi:hypothetical protein